MQLWVIYVLVAIFGLIFVSVMFLCSWKLLSDYWYEVERPEDLWRKSTGSGGASFHWGRRKKGRLTAMDLNGRDDMLLDDAYAESKSSSADFVI